MFRRLCWSCRGLPAFLAGVVLLWASGCSSKKPTLPETYPVRGKVVFQGGQPVPGGNVLFQPQNDTTVSTAGVIGPDGTFTLYSFKAGVRAAGAIAGPHRRDRYFPVDDHQRHLFPTIASPELFTVKAGENEFTLTVPKLSP